MACHFLDTSAILNGALKHFNNIYISPLAITELEHIKTSYNKDDKVKFLARQAVREIITNNNIEYFIIS
jgi:predicted subunit of tRNA(5-methylaminomethyl-2-thiouridylate) methyltransferase